MQSSSQLPCPAPDRTTTDTPHPTGLRRVVRKTGDEPLHIRGAPTGITLRAFWQWTASNLLGNTLRGHFAEFLVASALGTADGTRIEWDSFDVVTRGGLRVEVKSSAYVQAWKGRPSRISFNIAESKPWSWEQNRLGETARNSQLYVFCLFGETDEMSADATNLSQWQFYVVPTRTVTQAFGTQKTIGLAALRRLGVRPVDYSHLLETVSVLKRQISPAS